MIALWLATAAISACAPVRGDRILAGDMAAVWPAFGSVPVETALGFAPAPGARRVFGPAELARAAARFGITGPPPAAVCFERPTAPLTRERVLAAMHAADGLRDARIEIVELSGYPVPEGELVFARAGLQTPGPGSPTDAVTWKGQIRYSGRRFGVWARVVVSCAQRRIVAAAALRAGEAISPESVTVEAFEGFPSGGRNAESPVQVVGRRPRRMIAAGETVRLDLLSAVPEVGRGEAVQVEVRSGAARLAFTGRAESDGSIGDIVRVRNLSSRRSFAARVSGEGAVEVRTEEVKR